MRLFIITGMSGSGKTQVSRFFEDMGFFCVDNLPPVLIPQFVKVCSDTKERADELSIVVDTRSREFFDDFLKTLDSLDKNGVKYELIFVDANDETIVRRYKETRRRHPMADNNRITDGIRKERELLASVKPKANYTLDTSGLSKQKLKEKIGKIFGAGGRKFTVNILSFGFKYGIPMDADMVLDVRFLINPFYVEELRRKSGAVEEVKNYIENHETTQKFIAKLDDMIDFLLPEYEKEGKSQLVIAVGCTGGLHRSVYTAEHIYSRLKGKDYNLCLEHRDLMKNDVKEHKGEEN
ncbi:MAG: RNase adapter RapZ [Selenomonadaceae bacterium]|nr:RNase adapter RapZ [Selenomonadaceae bacterium]